MSVLCVLDLCCDGQAVAAQCHIGPDGPLWPFSSNNRYFFAVVGLELLVCNSHALNFSNGTWASP